MRLLARHRVNNSALTTQSDRHRLPLMFPAGVPLNMIMYFPRCVLKHLPTTAKFGNGFLQPGADMPHESCEDNVIMLQDGFCVPDRAFFRNLPYGSDHSLHCKRSGGNICSNDSRAPQHLCPDYLLSDIWRMKLSTRISEELDMTLDDII